MRRDQIELDYGYSEHKPNPLGCTVWVDCTDDKLGRMVMDKGKVLDDKWWQAKIKYGKHIHKKKIMM
ncbi:hypothetical protein LCGC14_0406920 [marine sediment metagenome]|uniref:Uncharacterized protein n=1 Tax=marine sediment metagenome TaxID=412755 RepID=A0A0F9TD96_9ZZZZ